MGELGTTKMHSGFSSDELLLSDVSVQETLGFFFTLIKSLHEKAVTCIKLNRPPPPTLFAKPFGQSSLTLLHLINRSGPLPEHVRF